MRLILKQYLASLRERDELDAILPDLLSQLGLNVFSRPGKGTRQNGVDVGAVGSLDDGPEKVYLFSIKAGDLTRRDWDGDSVQSLRPSLNEILDVYIPNRLPAEHRDKDVVICVCFGGDIQEQVGESIRSFCVQHQTSNITFEEWGGDKLAQLIQSSFLREDLLPQQAQSRLRKSLALLDEPGTSYKHFAGLIKSLAETSFKRNKDRLKALRQMSICLWILFSWARDAENLEAAYLASELTLLHGWKIAGLTKKRKMEDSQAFEVAFSSIFAAYQQINNSFLTTNLIPHVGKLHGLSNAVHASCSLDVNLKLFDLLGRLAKNGVWAYFVSRILPEKDVEEKQQFDALFQNYISSVMDLINNNPVLLLPVKDDQAIDIFIAVLLLSLDVNCSDFIKSWLAEMLNRANFAYEVRGHYPCILTTYSELLSHPKSGDDEYRKNVTSGSILYPMIALYAALLDDEKTYNDVANFKKTHLEHCNFQLWYPDEGSEEHIYTNAGSHGAVLSHVCVERSKEEFLEEVFGECEQSPFFKELSAIKFNWYPLIIVACRHYRLPLPIHLFEGFRKK